MKYRKITQITGFENGIAALADDGSLWVKQFPAEWKEVEHLPPASISDKDPEPSQFRCRHPEWEKKGKALEPCSNPAIERYGAKLLCLNHWQVLGKKYKPNQFCARCAITTKDVSVKIVFTEHPSTPAIHRFCEPCKTQLPTKKAPEARK